MKKFLIAFGILCFALWVFPQNVKITDPSKPGQDKTSNVLVNNLTNMTIPGDLTLPKGAVTNYVLVCSTTGGKASWMPISVVGSTNIAGANLGSNIPVFFSQTGSLLNFRTLIAGSGITLSTNSTDITPAVDGTVIRTTQVITTSSGAPDSGKIPALNGSGILDNSFLPSISSPFSVGFTSTNLAITSGGFVSQTHSLGGRPTLVQLELENTSTDNNYSPGDVLPLNPGAQDNSSGFGASVTMDITNCYIRYGNNGSSIIVLDKNSGAAANINNSKWVVRVKAWK